MIPRSDGLLPRIDTAMTHFDFELDDFVNEVNHVRRERSLQLLDAFLGAINAELENHAFLYDALTSDSEMLNLYGRQLLANHRSLRAEVSALVLARNRTVQLMDEEAEA